MLPEGEDLLQRLSGELGIPEFLDDLPMLEEAELPDANSFYETLMNDSGSVFEPMPQCEPDFTINFNGFPPSPSNSDTSSGSSNSIISALDVKDGILSPVQSHSPTTFSQEISPPVSPPAYPMQTNLQSNNGASIVSVSDLTNVKIPIPKIQKPSKCLHAMYSVGGVKGMILDFGLNFAICRFLSRFAVRNSKKKSQPRNWFGE